jgi:hypothetical protein
MFVVPRQARRVAMEPRWIDREALLAERRELRTRLATIERVMAVFGWQDDTPVGEVPLVLHGGQAPEPEPRERPTILQAAAEVIREAQGKPVHGSVILKALGARGVRVGGANPLNSLFGSLNRKPGMFRNEGGNRWVLVEPSAAGTGGAGEGQPKKGAVERSAKAKARAKRPGTLSPGAKMSVRAALERVLKKEGRAVRVRDLLAGVQEARGVPFAHRRPTAPIWQTVSQNKRVFRANRGWVGLASWRLDRWPEEAREE